MIQLWCILQDFGCRNTHSYTHTEEINLALPKNKQTHNRGFIFYDKMKDCNNDERNGDL